MGDPQMHRHISIVIVLFVFLTASGKQQGGEGPVKLSSSMESSYSRLVFKGERFLFEASIDVINLQLPGANDPFINIGIPGYYPHGEPGSPSLPLTSLLFEATDVDPTQIRIEMLDSVIFSLDSAAVTGIIRPAHPSLQKGGVHTGLWIDSTVYRKDEWLGGPLVRIEYEGRMRGLDMSNLHFSPVRYNPARRQLKLYSRVRCTIGVNRIQHGPVISGQAFSNLSSRVVRQDHDVVLKAAKAQQPMTLVILSDTIFREALQPLVEWKSRKGFRVIEAYRYDSVAGGSRESMKAYLKNLYLNPSSAEGFAPPTYLLIVGDVEHIPQSQYAGQLTDLYYATYDGEGDFIPDLYYGRISTSSASQLDAVVNKIIEYEQHLFPDPSFLDRSVLVAGADRFYASTYGNGQINYAEKFYLNGEQGRETRLFPYPQSQSSGGEIRALISGGLGFVNYTGHGLTDGWQDPAFTIAHIDDLQNEGMYPVMIVNGCKTNVYSLEACFAEELLRAPGKGALAYIGCTNDSYWDEDYYWSVGVGPISSNPDYQETSQACFDKVFHTHGEPHELWTPSLGEMIFGGIWLFSRVQATGSSFTGKSTSWRVIPPLFPGLLPLVSSR